MSLDAEIGGGSWAAVEQQICDDLPADLRHEPDSSETWDWYDATLVSPYEATPALPILGRPAQPGAAAELGSESFLPAGTRVEIKTCQTWTENGNKWPKRRRGRWTIHSHNHDKRVREGAVYLLVVRDAQAAVLATAAWVDSVIEREDRWTTGDHDHPGERACNLPWRSAISDERVEGGSESGDGGEGGGSA